MNKKILAAALVAGLAASPVWAATTPDEYDSDAKYAPPKIEKLEDQAKPVKTKKTMKERLQELQQEGQDQSAKGEAAKDEADKTAAGAEAGKEQAAAKTEETTGKLPENIGQANGEASTALPIILTADKADYGTEDGDFEAVGNVKIVQGGEILTTARAVGNFKTGDVYLLEGGHLIEPTNDMTAKWAHYNFKTKNGQLTYIEGKSGNDFYKAPHAKIEDGVVVADQGGTTTTCPAVKHSPCLSIRAKTITIIPGVKMMAKDVQVFVKGVHVYSRDYWEHEAEDDGEKLMPRIGFKNKNSGLFVRLEYEKPIIDNRTKIYTDQAYYTKAGYKPFSGIRHDEKNFYVRLNNGWVEDTDTDVWLHKGMDWGFFYKPHRIAKGLPLSYSGYITKGLWKYEDRNYSSWHTEKLVFINHDRIYPFETKKNTLDLGIGRKWVNESYNGEATASNIFSATMGQQISPKWYTWASYLREDKTSSLFNYGQADMAKELRNGVRLATDDRNSFSIVNRYDLGKSKNYETAYIWHHRFCCWVVELEYLAKPERENNSFNVRYNFLYW